MSFLETLVILVVAIVVLGPKRLPEYARKIGHWTGVLRRATEEFKRQIMTMDQRVEQSAARVAQDLDALVPEDEEEAPAPVAEPQVHPDALPPAATPDDFWGAEPVAGGLPVEPAEPEVAAVEAAAPTVVLNPTSFEQPREETKPRSLGLSPTRPAADREVSRG